MYLALLGDPLIMHNKVNVRILLGSKFFLMIILDNNKNGIIDGSRVWQEKLV